ncbi:MAG: hypothetical protein RJB26_1444 [Pseudomonadota bacterium]|jgi:hypothetical protein
MPLDLPKLRAWARKPHQHDDAALAMAWASAAAELEQRTGWCVDAVSRTQYVPEEPNNDEALLRLERQPVNSVTVVDSSGVTQTLQLTTINGIQYAKMDTNNVSATITVSYPVTITMNVGGTTPFSDLVEMALLQRATELEASRGDDTVALAGAYWDRICKMIGKAVG